MSPDVILARRHVETDPCAPGECPCEALGYHCPSVAGVHRHPVVGFCQKQKQDTAFRTALVEMARRDHEGNGSEGREHATRAATRDPIDCPHLSSVSHCQADIRHCRLGKGDAPGIVDLHHCRACQSSAIRLGIISPGCCTGGAEMWMLNLLGNLDHSRVIPVGVAVRYTKWIKPEMRSLIEQVAPVTVGIAAVDRLWQTCDVVLVWGVAAWDQRLPPRPRRARAVLVSHGVGPWTEPIFAEPDTADGWVAVSAAGLDPIPESHKARAAVLANGIDLERLVAAPGARELIRERLSVPAQRRLVAYLGRVSDEKNPRAFLECAAECEHRWPGRFSFVVIGDGLGWDAERSWAVANAPGVQWTGVQRNVGDWLDAADHVMMTSHEEADSLALLESFGASVPVVSTRVGRLREAEYAALARVVEVRPTAEILADALDLEATDPTVAGRVDRAKAIVLERHTSLAMAKRWMEYVECLTKPSSSSLTTSTTPSLVTTLT